MYNDALQFAEYWKNVRGRTIRVLEKLPEADLEWTHVPGKFTFGDLFRHLAGLERYMFAENVAHRPSRYPGHAQVLATGIVELKAYVARCHAEALEIFESLSATDLDSRCQTPAGRSITAWKWLRSMVEHEAHHRGQLYLMASMREMQVEPLYGLTEEQVADRSRAGG